MKIYKKKFLVELGSQCADVEVYKCISNNSKNIFHTDNLFTDYDNESLSVLPDEIECEFFEMDEEDYNANILANCGETCSFEELYGEKKQKSW